jgi:hypothetical protein
MSVAAEATRRGEALKRRQQEREEPEAARQAQPENDKPQAPQRTVEPQGGTAGGAQVP